MAGDELLRHVAPPSNVRKVDNASSSPLDHTAAAFIVVGLVMAAVCLIGCIPALFKHKILLNIYSDVLLVLLFVEAIVMAVYLANPDKLDAPFLGTIAKLLEEYKGKNEDNSTANVVWNAIMESGGRYLCPKNVMEEIRQDAGTNLLHAVKGIRSTYYVLPLPHFCYKVLSFHCRSLTPFSRFWTK